MMYQTNIPVLVPDLPGWARVVGAETPGNMAFQAGAALTVLAALISDSAQGVPVKLLASRLALRAATASSKLEGRLARAADIRDAYHLTPPGAAMGPDGELLAFWRAAVAARPTGRDEALAALMPPEMAGELSTWLEAGAARARSHGPLAGGAATLRAVLAADSRAERIACLLSDVVLARAVRWPVLLPVTAPGLTQSRLRALVAGEPGAAVAVQGKILASLRETVAEAREGARRAALLRAVAPKLRAKGSEAAVALFLAEDIVAPSTMLSPAIKGSATRMTDRAARRFCDRLVALGVAQERTGRSSFRLYGVLP